jgi:hypothetical protein
LAAPRLSHSRVATARDLRRQVDRVTRDTAEPAERLHAFVDRALLRGIPLLGGVGGCVTDQPIPGDDQHLEQLG